MNCRTVEDQICITTDCGNRTVIVYALRVISCIERAKPGSLARVDVAT